MQITEITVSYEATQSLSGYCNVRPGIRLTAHVGEGESFQEIKTRLLNDARAIVQEEIDAALIRDDQPPRYYAGPRFRIEHNRETHQIVILPDTRAAYRKLEPFGAWLSHPFIKPIGKMSANQAQTVAIRLADYLVDATDEVYTIVDCSDGNLDRLAVGQPMRPAQTSVEPDPGDPSEGF